MSSTDSQTLPNPSTGSGTIYRVINCRLVMDHKVYIIIIFIFSLSKKICGFVMEKLSMNKISSSEPQRTPKFIKMYYLIYYI